MQLRKVCSHPILFEGLRMHLHVMDEQHIDASRKMMVCERLLTTLLAHRHKVLLFSRFVTARRYRGKRSPFCGRVWQAGSLSTVSEVGLSAGTALSLGNEYTQHIIFYFGFH